MTNLEKGFKLVKYEDGTTQYVAYAPIPSTKFSIGVVVSEEEINALVEETEDKMSTATTISIVVILAVVAGTIIAAVVASVVLASRITKPIKQLTVLADRITEGNLTFEFTEDYNDEMRTLAQTFQNLLVTLRLGNVAYYEGDTHRAFENYKSALSLFNATGNKKGQSMALNNLGNIYRNWKDIKQARRHYEKAIQLDKGAKNVSGEASRYVNIGLLYEEQGDDLTARKYYQQALTLYKKAKDQRGEARVYNNMGLLRADSGDLQGALDYFIRAHEIDMVLNDRRGLSTRLNNMAIIYKKSRQYQKAINLLKNSMELSESYEDKTGVMNNLSNIAQTYKEMGDHKGSEAYQKRFEKLRDQVLKTTKKKSVIFVIDTSGSMEGERLDSAKEGALNMYKRKIYDEDLISLVEFPNRWWCCHSRRRQGPRRSLTRAFISSMRMV
jgi:tetratricopeptide (TPR) repeat protein